MLNNQSIKIFNTKCDIGGYLLPADFPYLKRQFLRELQPLSFTKRVEKIYSLITNKSVENLDLSAVKDIEEQSLILAFDDCLSCLDLSCASTASYNDFIFDKSDLLSKVACLIGVFTSTYLDLVESSIVEFYDTINFTCPTFDGIFVLSLMLAKKMGLPINCIICPIEKFVNIPIKSLFLSNFISDEISEVIYEFFNDFGYLFDELSASQIIALDEYYSSYEDEKFTVSMRVVSPYYFSRSIYKTLTKKIELNINRAISKLYEESAESVPEYIEEKQNYFYNELVSLDFHTAFSIIKSMNKIWFL